jgi:aspartate kinase
MKVFKFGGASVKDASAVRNMYNILLKYPDDDLCIIFSAMGKTTNALEKVADAWIREDSSLEGNITVVEEFHLKIVDELGVETRVVDKWISQLREITSWLPLSNYDEGYDRVVSIGELLSTEIISAFLKLNNYAHHRLDARKLVKTDSNYRNARLDWEETQRLITLETIKYSCIQGRKVYITQGFIGSTKDTHTVTLGREGSDFSAAIFAWALKAEGNDYLEGCPRCT